MTKSRFRLTILAAAIASLSALAAVAQTLPDPNLGDTAPPTATVPEAAFGDPSPDAFGSARGATFIAATKFLPVDDTTPPLTYEIYQYYHASGTATPKTYVAQMDGVPIGAAVDMVSCIYNDPSATNNMHFELQKYQTDFNTKIRSYVASPASFTSSGTPGVTFVNMTVSPTETIRHIVGNTAITYWLRADVAADTSFSGCTVAWTRQISPAPGVASFTDVPTSNPFFQVIEALKASGITAGCTATQFCPDAPVSRAAMAAFLARALGLNWPY